MVGLTRGEPPRVFARLVRLNHVAVTGLESRVAGLRAADVATSDAGTRLTFAGFIACIVAARHSCAPIRLSLISSALGLVTGVDLARAPWVGFDAPNTQTSGE